MKFILYTYVWHNNLKQTAVAELISTWWRVSEQTSDANHKYISADKLDLVYGMEQKTRHDILISVENFTYI